MVLGNPEQAELDAVRRISGSRIQQAEAGGPIQADDNIVLERALVGQVLGDALQLPGQEQPLVCFVPTRLNPVDVGKVKHVFRGHEENVGRGFTPNPKRGKDETSSGLAVPDRLVGTAQLSVDVVPSERPDLTIQVFARFQISLVPERRPGSPRTLHKCRGNLRVVEGDDVSEVLVSLAESPCEFIPNSRFPGFDVLQYLDRPEGVRVPRRATSDTDKCPVPASGRVELDSPSREDSCWHISELEAVPEEDSDAILEQCPLRFPFLQDEHPVAFALRLAPPVRTQLAGDRGW